MAGLLTLTQAIGVRLPVSELGSLKTEEDDDAGVREGARYCSETQWPSIRLLSGELLVRFQPEQS